jgi:DNA modification methylase
MQIEYVGIDTIIPNEKNPRNMSKVEMRKLVDSINEFGIVDPILINTYPGREGTIVGGHQRWTAMKHMGYKEVPIVKVHLPENKELILNIALNRISGEFNSTMLSELLNQLMDSNENFTLTGFDESEIALITNDAKRIEAEREQFIDNIPESPKKPISKLGDLYQLGENHLLLCGDATNNDHVKVLVGKEKIDIIVTDPPYGVSYKGTNNPNGKDWGIMYNDDLRDDGLYNFLFKICDNYQKFSKENPAMYMFYASVNHIIFENALVNTGWRIKQQIIWDKHHVLGHSDYHWSHEPVLYCSKKDVNTEWFGDRTSKTTIMEQWVDEWEELSKEQLIQIMKNIRENSDVMKVSKDPVQSYLHACLTPESIVVGEKGYQKIINVQIGDKLLSHDGQFHEVIDLSNHEYNKKIYEIYSESTNLKCTATDNHPFLIAKPIKKGTCIKDWQISFKKAEELEVGDYTMTPIITDETINEFSKEFCYLIGMFLGDGHFQKAGHGKNIYPAFSLNTTTKMHLVEFIKEKYEEKVKCYNQKESGISVMIFDKDLGNLLLELCNKGAYTKRLHPKLMKLSKECTESLLKGYIACDGSKIRNYYTATTISSSIASQICMLAEKIGMRSACYIYDGKNPIIEGRIMKNTHPVYRLYFYPQNMDAKRRMKYYDNILYEGTEYSLRRIKQIYSYDYVDRVYNVEIEGTHTFQTAIGMSHNTQKPVEILRRFIQNSSKPMDLVADFCGGSFSTLIACESTKRRCISMDLNPLNCDIGIKRFETYSGKKAKFIRNILE